MSNERNEDSTQTIVAGMLEQAVNWYTTHLEPKQVEATEFYNAESGILDAEEGRSKVTSSDLRDAVRAIMPSVLRMLGGPEHALAFTPRGAEDEPLALQITDYVKLILWERNNGFLLFHSIFKDAMIRKLGIAKWWVEDDPRITSQQLSGLTVEQVALLMSDEQNRVTIKGKYNAPNPLDGQPETLFDASLFRVDTTQRIRVAAVPPNEFIFTPNSRSLDDAPLVAHVREMKVSDLIAMGIDEALIEKARGKHPAANSEQLEGARSLDGGDPFSSEPEGDDSVQPVLYAEAYVLIDLDDDGIAERRMFQCVGPDYELVDEEGTIVDDVPFADFPMDPEPHAIIGQCLHDYLKDVQLVKSKVLRSTLDSLALALDQKTEVVAGEVNLGDLVKNELGGVVRVRKPGMMREITHDYLGDRTMPMLGYMDETKENRTGVSKAAAGLDADSLQSATKAAVAATLTGAQQHIEMIARIFAETGMRRLYRGLLRTVVRIQPRAEMVRMRGSYVEVDPRTWNADLDVEVTLSSGSPQDRLQSLMFVHQTQLALLQAGAPLVGFAEIRTTLARILELSGFRNADAFFKPFGPQEEQQFQQAQASQQTPPDPNMALVQVEAQKAQVEMTIQQQKFELEQWKAQREDDRERDKIARDFMLKLEEIKAKYAVQMQVEQVYADVERQRATLDADVTAQEMAQAHEQQLQQNEMQHAEKMQQAEQAAAAPAGGGA